MVHYSRIDDFNGESAGKNPTPRSQLLRTSLESLLTNTNYPAEVIVMDNGGDPDDSDYLLGKAREGKITHVRFPQNLHFAHAWNTGAKIATGDTLSFICNDIEFLPGWLNVCMEMLEKYPERELLATPFITYDKHKYTFEVTPEGYRVNLRSGSNCMVLPRTLWQKVGEFPIHRIGGSLWYNQLAKLGIRTIAPPEDLALDRGWRQGVNFRRTIEVKKLLLDNSEVHFELPQ